MEVIIAGIIIGGLAIASISGHVIHWASRRPANGEVKKVQDFDRHCRNVHAVLCKVAPEVARRYEPVSK